MKLLLRNITSFFGQSKYKTVLYSFGLIVEVAIECSYAIILKIVLDYIIIPKNYRLFTIAIICFIAAIIIYTFTVAFRNLLYSRMYAGIFRDYNNSLLHKILQLSTSYFARTRPGDLISYFTSDMSSIETLYKVSVPTCIFAAVKILVNTVLIFVLDWRLAILSVVGLIVTMFGPFPLDRMSADTNNTLKDCKSQMASLTEESIAAQLVIKSFNMHEIVQNLFSQKSLERSKLEARMYFINSLIQNSRLILFTVFSLALISFGSYMAMKGVMTAGNVVAFSSLFAALGTSVGHLAINMPLFSDSLASIRRIDDFFNTVPELSDMNEPVIIRKFTDSIELKDITFGYDGQEPVLKDINLVIPKDASVAFVGHSGSGKSSILNLLLRLYDVNAGSILIDGFDIRSLSQKSLHDIMNIVLQENFLFNTTIKENMLYASPDACMDDIIKAAKAAEIHDFITGLPNGYDTVVGERGGQLSGGQRQRISLARALLCDPSILLLDEATSALDPKTEASINDTLMRIAGEKTLIAVTHRLSSVKDYSMIVVMDKGRIAEVGSHNELLGRKGIYSILWEKQSGFVVDQELEYAEIEAERLSKLPLFKHMNVQLLQTIADMFVSEHYAPGSAIIEEGDYGDKFYIIVRGVVDVLRRMEGNDTKKIDVLQDGDYFGEVALLKNVPRTATIKSVTPCLLLSLQRKKFARVLETAPDVKEALEKEADIRFSRWMGAGHDNGSDSFVLNGQT